MAGAEARELAEHSVVVEERNLELRKSGTEEGARVGSSLRTGRGAVGCGR